MISRFSYAQVQFRSGFNETLPMIRDVKPFYKLDIKNSTYLYMKVLNERILKWAHLSFCHKRFSRYLHLKLEKEVIFLGRFSSYEIPESGDKTSNF